MTLVSKQKHLALNLGRKVFSFYIRSMIASVIARVLNTRSPARAMSAVRPLSTARLVRSGYNLSNSAGSPSGA
jgi:hypothetical protein